MSASALIRSHCWISLCVSIRHHLRGRDARPEANAALEAARVGIAVLTTIHSNSSEGTYRRMVSLCKRAVDTPDDTLMGYVTEAYPIVVYCRQLENKQRRITNISECEILPDGSRRLHKLYEYHITDNHLEDDHFIIEGEHRKCEEISESLRRRFIENGCRLESWHNSFKERRKMNDYDPADRLHRHDRRAFYGTACLAAGTERQPLCPFDRSSRQYPCRYQRDDQAKKRRGSSGVRSPRRRRSWQPPDEQIGSPMVCFTSLLCFALGACIAIAAGNAFLVPVLAVGLMLTPFWYVKLTAGSFKKDVAAELETALSVITTAYLRTKNFQQAVEENVRYLHPPVQEVFPALSDAHQAHRPGYGRGAC